jgi:hypothetical protein
LVLPAAARQGATVTLISAVVQQHLNPLPPSPETSFAWARTTYSPGASKVAVVPTRPPGFPTEDFGARSRPGHPPHRGRAGTSKPNVRRVTQPTNAHRGKPQ